MFFLSFSLFLTVKYDSRKKYSLFLKYIGLYFKVLLLIEEDFTFLCSELKKKEEHKILSQIRKGDESPIFEIYKIFRDEFLMYAKTNYNSTSEQSKDAFQEAVIDFHQNVISGKLTELSSSLKTYLFQIGKHKLLNILQKERRITYHDSIHLIKGEKATDFMKEENRIYTQEQINNAINKLPEDCQEVLKLYYFKEFDMNSIARDMNYKNANTAKSKKSVCMKRLVAELNKITSMIFL